MLKVLIISIFILFIYEICIFGEKLTEFQDYFKAPAVLMDNNHLCVWDQPQRKIRVYSLWDFKKVSDFGRKGQGPGEFIGISKVSLWDDKVLVSSYPKLCFFVKKGKLVKELKGPTEAGSFVPFGKNFIGTSYPYTKPNEKKGKILFSLFDSKLKKIKDISISEINKIYYNKDKKGIVTLPNSYSKVFIYEDKLYISSPNKGLNFSIFDINGNRLYDININQKRIKVTDECKRRIISEAKKNWGESRWKQFIAMYEIRVPEFYPAYANFFIDNEKIYVFRHPGEKKQEITIIDLKGNILDKKEIPVLETPGCIVAGRFSINSGRLYYMVENEETDVWELHEINIDGDPKG